MITSLLLLLLLFFSRAIFLLPFFLSFLPYSLPSYSSLFLSLSLSSPILPSLFFCWPHSLNSSQFSLSTLCLFIFFFPFFSNISFLIAFFFFFAHFFFYLFTFHLGDSLISSLLSCVELLRFIGKCKVCGLQACLREHAWLLMSYIQVHKYTNIKTCAPMHTLAHRNIYTHTHTHMHIYR